MMMKPSKGRVAELVQMAALLALAGGVVGAAPAVAARTDHPSTAVNATLTDEPGALYVSPSGKSTGEDTSCENAKYSTIESAVTAAPSGGTVTVCTGTYSEDVLVSQPLVLQGQDATINATGLVNGIVVDSSNVTVSGFAITGARGEGIAVIPSGVLAGLTPPFAPVTHVTISDNTVSHDDTGYVAPAGCTAPDLYPGDCGGGILIDAVADSVVEDNDVNHNVDGILLVDDFGPSYGNLIKSNKVDDNVNECGITLPSHNSGAASYVAGPGGIGYQVTGLNPAVGGVYDNTVVDNVADGNGTGGFKANAAGSGAGILLASAGAGTAVYDNLIEDNEAHGNGLAGVTLHAHFLGGEYLNGNRIVGNDIGTNNVTGDTLDTPLSAADFATTGITLFTAVPITVTVSGNAISGDHFGIWSTPNVTFTGGGNSFSGVAVSSFREHAPFGSGLTAVGVGSTTATLIGFGVPNGSETVAFFQWGTGIPFYTATPPQTIGSGTGVVPFSANLTGLSPSTTYLFQLVLTNDYGTASGLTGTFTTT